MLYKLNYMLNIQYRDRRSKGSGNRGPATSFLKDFVILVYSAEIRGSGQIGKGKEEAAAGYQSPHVLIDHAHFIFAVPASNVHAERIENEAKAWL